MKCKTTDLAITLILIYTFFFQVFLTSAFAKYFIFATALGLIIWRKISLRVNEYNILWIALIFYMIVRSKSIGDVPITLAIIVMLGILLSANDSWGRQYFKTLTICTRIHSVITILCCAIPYFHEAIIVPLFFQEFAGRVETSYRAGLTNHYSTNGMYLGIGFVCAAIHVMTCPCSKKRKATIWAIINLVALILTTKRTHLAAAILVTLIVLLIYSKHQGKLYSGIMKAVLLVIAGISLFFIAAVFIPGLGVIVERFVELGEDTTLHGRTYFYEVAYEQWKNNPIFGSGWGGFSEAFNQTQLGQAYISSGFAKIQPHNVYLQLLSDLGIVGLIIFIIIVALAISKGIKAAKSVEPNNNSYTCIGIIIFVLVCGLTGNPLNDIQLYCPFVLSCMLLYTERRERCYQTL